MKELADILGDPVFSGVYALQTDTALSDLNRFLTGRGLAAFSVNGKHVRTKDRFLTAFAEALQFPDYFGFNWDAFEDCLSDMSWHGSDGFSIIYDGFDVFLEHDPDEADTALDILMDSAEYWRNEDRTFLVLLLEAGGIRRELPAVRFHSDAH
ncbi:MAG: barstar family protein [Pseudomonadota bacterium]